MVAPDFPLVLGHVAMGKTSGRPSISSSQTLSRVAVASPKGPISSSPSSFFLSHPKFFLPRLDPMQSRVPINRDLSIAPHYRIAQGEEGERRPTKKTTSPPSFPIALPHDSEQRGTLEIIYYILDRGPHPPNSLPEEEAFLALKKRVCNNNM